VSISSAILGFALVAGLITIVPGLDTAMVLRSTISHGRRHGFATAIGVSSGALIWGAGAAVGVSALLVASTFAYTCVRIAGAVYMIWLGVRLLARVAHGAGAALELDSPPTGQTLVGSWRRGLTTNLLNPKIGAFYIAVLPQFIPPHVSHLAFGLLLALVHDLESIIWFTAIILAVHSVRSLLQRRSTQRAVDGVTGLALLGFGIKLGLSSK
jgi:threonine/homoserine/homoserine lactone efflux protein